MLARTALALLLLLAPRELTFSFPLGEFKAVRRIRSDEEQMMRTLFDLWLRQVMEP